MTKEKLLIAQERLQSAFDNLEKTIINKIDQTREKSGNSTNNNNENSDNIIEKLTGEIQLLQKNFADSNQEKEILEKDNKQLLNKVNNLKIDGDEIVNRIQFNLGKIKEIINKNK